MSTETAPAEPAAGNAFGTFKGVYTPSILTILGVVMYLRFPWVLGSVGLPATLVIVTLSVAITALTGLSISAMATNMKVGGGGAYFMISRTLGVEAGAAVGLPLFLTQSLGIAFYIVGFSETVVAYFPHLSPELVGVGTLLALTLLAYRSADLALKTQFVILSLLGLSLVSLFAGGSPVAATTVVGESLPAVGFWVAFAVFFPAVTGIEAGLGMSGDLKNPSKSLPLGTLLAVATGLAIYLAIPIFLSNVVADPADLRGDSLIMTRVARWPILVLLGILGASLSSAMGALLGAPRTLQALAQDAVLPRALGRGFGPTQEPRLATVVAFVIALAGILLGDLNAIGPILSMFFLTSYAVLNLSAGFEGLIGGPAWRPSFNVPWWVSMLGFVGCVIAMLMIDSGATILATVVTVIVYVAIQRRELTAQWGDVKYGVLVLVIRIAIEALARQKADARSWSPNVLVLTGTMSDRWHLVVFARAMAGESGFLTVASVVPYSIHDQRRQVDEVRSSIKAHLEENKISALVKVATDTDVSSGLIALVKSYGFGPLVPNTVVLGKSATPDSPLKHAELLSTIQRRRRNLVVVHEARDLPELQQARRIDLWWGGHHGNEGLMLALAFLITKHQVWARAEVVICTSVTSADEVDEARAQLETVMAGTRFRSRTHVVVADGDVFQTIRRHSRPADLLFMGLRPRGDEESLEEYANYYAELTQRTDGFPPTILVCAGEEVALQRLFASA